MEFLPLASSLFPPFYQAPFVLYMVVLNSEEEGKVSCLSLQIESLGRARCPVTPGQRAEAGLAPPPGTVLAASPADPQAKSGPNPAVAGRITGPEIELLSPFVSF